MKNRDNITVITFTVRTFKTQIEPNWYSREIHLQISWWDIFSAISAQLVRPPLAPYSSLCSTCVTYGTLCHAPALPTQPYYRECYGFERAFLTLRRFLRCTPFCCFQGFLGSWQFNLKASRASCWSSKHSASPTICLNHSNPQKVSTGRF